MRFDRTFMAAYLIMVAICGSTVAAEQVLTAKLHHLRNGQEREWSDFPNEAESSSLKLIFQAKPNATEFTLRLRQQDVKQTWKVLLNGKIIGQLLIDENDTVIRLAVPSGSLVDGENTLVIEQAGSFHEKQWSLTASTKPCRNQNLGRVSKE